MIHHVSIGARNPRHVADVLAEVMGGKCYPFPGGFKDSWIAVSGDPRGTAIEVYPEGLNLRPDGDAAVRTEEAQSTPVYTPFHLLLSVSTDQATIERIGKREGWITRLCDRGPPGKPPMFSVIEFWLENRLMVELAPQDMIGAYERVLQIDKLDAMMAAREAAD
jgi:hypothetical protein